MKMHQTETNRTIERKEFRSQMKKWYTFADKAKKDFVRHFIYSKKISYLGTRILGNVLI